MFGCLVRTLLVFVISMMLFGETLFLLERVGVPKWFRELFVYVGILVVTAISLLTLRSQVRKGYQEAPEKWEMVRYSIDPAGYAQEVGFQPIEITPEQAKVLKRVNLIGVVLVFIGFVGSVYVGGVFGPPVAQLLHKHHPETNFVIVLSEPCYLFVTFFAFCIILLITYPYFVRVLSGEHFEVVKVALYGPMDANRVNALHRRIALFAVAPCLIFALMTLNTYTRFTEDYIAINRFLSFTEKRYSYQDIVSINYYTHRLARGRAVESPHFLIRFRDGTEFDTGGTNYTRNLQAIEPLMQKVSARSGVPLRGK